VSLLYGPAWMDSAWVLALLFLCLPAWSCWGLSTPVLWNTGRKHYEFLLQLPLLALAAPAWWFFAPQGIRAVAAVSAVVIFARAVVIIGASLRALGLSWSAVAPYALRGLGLATVCAGAVLLGQYAVAAFTAPVVSLSAGAACALAAMLLLVLARPQVLGNEARSALGRLIPAFTPRFAAPAAPELDGGAR
jgi:lipopolysaccharide exporter